MHPNEIWPFLIVPLVIIASLFYRFYILAGLDKERISEEIVKYGHSVEEITWNPFGRGWFGEKGERYYDVTYRMHNGQVINTGCKTSMMTGVYWTGKSPDFVKTLPEKFRLKSIKCHNCKVEINKNSKFCPNCGNKRYI